MLSNPPISEPIINYPAPDSSLSFADYITQCRALITERRTDLPQNHADQLKIIDANSPYECRPTHPVHSDNGLKYGALLLHGLFDSPFTFRDISAQLQQHGILSRAMLLPGHGTTPTDLLHVSHKDWISTLRYGVDSLHREVDRLFLIGYSTGAALSVFQAMQDERIAGIILLSPAIKLKATVDFMMNWHRLIRWMHKKKQWLHQQDEQDYAKYQSITLNSAIQVFKLTRLNDVLLKDHTLKSPMLMVLSHEDETISSRSATQFFSGTTHVNSKLLLYTARYKRFTDTRILQRLANYPELRIKHFSHISIPFAPTNPHYGQHGDYRFASHLDNELTYGAYDQLGAQVFNLLDKTGLLKKKHRELTYNPDFNFMANEIVQFILGNG